MRRARRSERKRSLCVRSALPPLLVEADIDSVCLPYRETRQVSASQKISVAINFGTVILEAVDVAVR